MNNNHHLNMKEVLISKSASKNNTVRDGKNSNNRRKILWASLPFVLSASILTACTAPKTGSSALNGSASTLAGTATPGTTTAGTTTNKTGQVGTGNLQAVNVKYDSEDYYFNWKSGSYQTINLENGSSTISKSGIYEITGTLREGSLVVDIDKTADKGAVYLVLNNAGISSTKSAPILVKGAKKVVLILENGTTNTLYQGSGVTVDKDGDPSAALFSKADLTITGSGTLKVTSDFNDGITGKDELKITDGIILIQSKADGIVGKDLLAVEKGNITINAGKDGMRSTNETDAGMGNIVIKDGSFNITANNDAMQAYGILETDGGRYNISTGGGYPGKSLKTNMDGPGMMGGRPGQVIQKSQTANSDTESRKGLKANGGILLINGTFNLSTNDDSIHSDGDILINGGTINLQAGDDGIHSETTVTINGGSLNIKDSYEGIEGKNITLNNGKISLTSSDDSFNVNNSSGLLTINGGEVSLNAGGDGLDSNGSVKMTGGIVTVDGPTANNNGAIDYDGKFTITGGTVVASGSSGMAEAPDSTSSQPSILMYYSSLQAAGTKITLKDSTGNTLASSTPTKAYASVAISAPGMKTGSNYTLYKGETKLVTFTLSNAVTYLNESGVTTGRTNGPGGGGPAGGSGGPAGGVGGPKMR